MSETYTETASAETAGNKATATATPAATSLPFTAGKPEVTPSLDLSAIASPVPANDTAATKLNSGDYYLQELSVSDSYFMDTTPINIHLEYKDAETKTITAKAVKENTQTTNVVSKVDVTGSKEIDGCKLEITDESEKKVISWTSGDKDSVKVYVTEKDGYQNFKYSFDEKGNLLVGGLFHDKDYTLTETRPADGYVTADAITYQIKSVAASSPAADTENTVASGSAVTVNPVSGSAVSGEAGVSYTSVVSVKKKHRRGIYTGLLLNGELMKHCLEIQEQAEERFEILTERLADSQGVTEAMKQKDPWKWTKEMNMVYQQAEEIILKELIYR